MELNCLKKYGKHGTNLGLCSRTFSPTTMTKDTTSKMIKQEPNFDSNSKF